MDWSSKLTFKEFAYFCDKCSGQEENVKRQKFLKRFLDSCRERMGPEEGDSLYPVMRLMLPYLDKARGAYRIKESVMATLYINMLQLGTGSPDANRLKNYRAPKNNFEGAGDFASVLFEILEPRAYSGDSVTVADINNHLNDIVSTNETEGRSGVTKILQKLFLKMDAIQQKWLVRIILKDMRLRLGETTIFTTMHPDAKDYFEVNADLLKICQKLKDPSKRLQKLDVTLLSPFRPQLADRLVVSMISKKMGDREFYIETKYDGERCQLHKQGNTFRFFSRNGFDFTLDYGESKDDVGKFSHVISRCLDSNVTDIILDGEMCAWSKVDNCLLQKSEQFNIRQLGADDPKIQQCLVLYDIVYLNGRALSDLPLKERITILDEVITVEEGRVMMCERKVARTNREVVDSLNAAIDRREEGLVIKDMESVYKPGARAKSGWIKVKPEYQNELMDQLDLLILGGYYGKGRDGGKVSHFLMGLGDTKSDQFVSVCRVSSGYTDSQLASLSIKLASKVITKPDPRVQYGKEKPDVLYNPISAPVLQVKAAEIIVSDTYAIGATLRFPRVEIIRDDKDSSCCTSLQEFLKIKEAGGGKLFGNTHLSDISSGTEQLDGRKRRRVGGGSRAAGLGQIYRQQENLEDKFVSSHSLLDKVVVVEPVHLEKKRKIEQLVTRHGGKVEQNVRPGKTDLYVETGMKVKGRNIVASETVDVVSSGWVLDQGEDIRAMMMPLPHQYVWWTQQTARDWAERSDSFLDPLVIPATRDSLRFSMDRVEEMGRTAQLTESVKASLESECDMSDSRTCLFREMVFYFDSSNRSSETVFEQTLAKRKVKFCGGLVNDDLDDKVSHVVVTDVNDIEEHIRSDRKRRLENKKKLFHVVEAEWIDGCVSEGKILS